MLTRWLVVLAVFTAPGCAGELELTGGPGPDAALGPGEMVDIEGPAVRSHVQAFADAACTAVGACTVSTYAGHHPSAELALDTLVSDVYGSFPSDDNALGDAHAEFALANQADFGIWYVIWRQRYNDGSGWEPMEDRGSITQNHYDHVHVSFNEAAP